LLSHSAQVVRIATDICKALAFLQDHKQTPVMFSDASAVDQQGVWGDTASEAAGDNSDESGGEEEGGGPAGTSGMLEGGMLPAGGAVLSAYALRTIVTPSNVSMDAQVGNPWGSLLCVYVIADGSTS
jgi:hypothetical protein